MIGVLGHLIGVGLGAWFGTIGVLATIDLHRNGGLMGHPAEENER